MTKIIVILMVALSFGLYADTTPLFGKVINVSKNDTLNIRSQANYRSEKVGELPPDAYIGIEKCQNIKGSSWCEIYQIPQQFYENFQPGWVNTRYLQFSNRGYVNIQGETRGCHYALACEDDKCSVVKSFDYDFEKDILSNLVIEQISRDRLKPTSNFGAVERDGICNSGRMIDHHFNKQNLNRLSQVDSGEAYSVVISLVEGLRKCCLSDEIKEYIHPVKGLVLTWNVLFGAKDDKHFTIENIVPIRDFDKKKIHWGKTYGKGDDVYMNLYGYFAMLTRPIRDITEIEKLKDLKGFKNNNSVDQVGYEVFWINEKSETKEYDYLGLVVILEVYQGKWYVVGLLRDRWTI